jgi:integrase
VEITEKNLRSFRQWLIDRGRSDDTAELYTLNLRRCAAHPRGITHRLVGGDLAPNTARTNLAALRAWATFAKDATFLTRLSDLRLPPARRVKAKLPLDAEDWRRVVRHIQTCDISPEPMRHVLLIMAMRGMRAGDVLRIRRPEVVRALDSGKLSYEGKGRKRIEFSAIPIRQPLEALAQIKGWDRVSDLISKGKSRRGAGRKVWRAAVRTAKEAGILHVNPHRYRHTFATRFLDELKGDPNAIVKLQQYMNWESISTASRYVSAVSQDELDRIGAGLVENLLRK